MHFARLMVDQIEGQRGAFYTFGDQNNTGLTVSVPYIAAGLLNIREEIRRPLTGWVRCIIPRLPLVLQGPGPNLAWMHSTCTFSWENKTFPDILFSVLAHTRFIVLSSQYLNIREEIRRPLTGWVRCITPRLPLVLQGPGPNLAWMHSICTFSWENKTFPDILFSVLAHIRFIVLSSQYQGTVIVKMPKAKISKHWHCGCACKLETICAITRSTNPKNFMIIGVAGT
jgi:hypothetical protein